MVYQPPTAASDRESPTRSGPEAATQGEGQVVEAEQKQEEELQKEDLFSGGEESAKGEEAQGKPATETAAQGSGTKPEQVSQTPKAASDEQVPRGLFF